MDAPLLGPPDKLRIACDGPIHYIGRLDDGMQYMTFGTRLWSTSCATNPAPLSHAL